MKQFSIIISFFLLFLHSFSSAQQSERLKDFDIDDTLYRFDNNCHNSVYTNIASDKVLEKGHYFIYYHNPKYSKLNVTVVKVLYTSSGDIINGKREGWWTYEYPYISGNNVRKYEIYKNGLLINYYVDLIYKENTPIRKVLYKSDFKNGTGCYKDYNHNGIVIAEGNYKDGCKDKWWKYYNDKGLLIRKEKYNKGILKKLIPIN